MVVPSVLSHSYLIEFSAHGLNQKLRSTTIRGWKTCEIGARQGANPIRNTAWRRFSSGFRQVY